MEEIKEIILDELMKYSLFTEEQIRLKLPEVIAEIAAGKIMNKLSS